MAVEFGLALVERHPKSHLTKWMDDIEALLPKLEGHFQSVWMTDHLFWEEDFAYEVWTVLTWLAARWPSFSVGPMVMGQNYRNPALLAKMGATLQVFSRGRFIMGVGAGWKEDEYRAYNYEMPPVAVRMEQLEDTLEILKRLWTQPGKVTYQGKHYRITDAILEPKPDPVPKIVVGGGGKKTMRIAAKLADWWNLSDAGIAKFHDRHTILKQHLEDLGRDPKTLRLTWFGRIVVGRAQAEITARANSRTIKYSTENAFVGTPAQVVEQMQEFVANGVDYFMVDVLDFPNPDIVGMIVEEIFPKVRSS
jgi:alkanesulfonate monooxygenase SsuD/methylene tetrahydromethanopterin reductase-like flavin-dependent oxidoreductase (luciferase family)